MLRFGGIIRNGAQNGGLRSIPRVIRSSTAKLVAPVRVFSKNFSSKHDHIPVVDFAKFHQSSAPATRRQCADEVHHACGEVGFIYLQNVIPQSELNEIFRMAREFFALSDADKKRLPVWVDAESNVGFQAVGREILDPRYAFDLKECYNHQLNDGTVWPEDLVKYKDNFDKLFRMFATKSQEVLRAFAVSFNLDEKFFDSYHSNMEHTLRLLHYPKLAQQPLPGQLRAGEHTDYGSLTLLIQDDAGGLQVQGNDGKWYDGQPVPGAVVVNTGDMMNVWTNEHFRSTKHRVTFPPNAAERERYSIAYFVNPNASSLIKPITKSADEKPKYGPVVAGDWLLSKLKGTYDTYMDAPK